MLGVGGLCPNNKLDNHWHDFYLWSTIKLKGLVADLYVRITILKRAHEKFNCIFMRNIEVLLNFSQQITYIISLFGDLVY